MEKWGSDFDKKFETLFTYEYVTDIPPEEIKQLISNLIKQKDDRIRELSDLVNVTNEYVNRLETKRKELEQELEILNHRRTEVTIANNKIRIQNEQEISELKKRNEELEKYVEQDKKVVDDWVNQKLSSERNKILDEVLELLFKETKRDLNEFNIEIWNMRRIKYCIEKLRGE